jgi:hypothetical protein
MNSTSFTKDLIETVTIPIFFNLEFGSSEFPQDFYRRPVFQVLNTDFLFTQII